MQRSRKAIVTRLVASDIGETNNLADKEPERVVTMKARLMELLRNAAPSGAPNGNDAE